MTLLVSRIVSVHDEVCDLHQSQVLYFRTILTVFLDSLLNPIPKLLKNYSTPFRRLLSNLL